MELREKLLALKTENGLTTDALSERSGVPKGTINKLLNGETRNPTAQTLRRLAEALNCPLEALCGRPTDIPGVYRLGALTSDAKALMERGELMPVHRKKVPLLGEIADMQTGHRGAGSGEETDRLFRYRHGIVQISVL